MERTFVQLYRLGGEWVAQFKDVRAAEKYVAKLKEDMNDYEIKFEESKYPQR
jgi:hypothetical protein